MLRSCAAIARTATSRPLSRVGLAPPPRFAILPLLAGARRAAQPIARLERGPRIGDQPDRGGPREHRRGERGVAAMLAGARPAQPAEVAPLGGVLPREIGGILVGRGRLAAQGTPTRVCHGTLPAAAAPPACRLLARSCCGGTHYSAGRLVRGEAEHRRTSVLL